MEIYVKDYFHFFSGFQTWFYQIRWCYPDCSFKHRK